MKVKISIEQTVDIDEAMRHHDIGFDEYAPADMSNEDKVAFLINRFAEDIGKLVEYDEVLDNISVEYIEE
jgi:hypothetical protein